jgi:hypothetical protein
VSGKPGSGKSTLTKYPHDHEEVTALLEEWAGSRKLSVASFFSWNLGTQEQNSQQGLARGLLFHLLLGNESLIRVVLPGMWKAAQMATSWTELKLPSVTEMSQAFVRLGSEATDGGAYTFFIDGLDELTGNIGDGIAFMQQLARNPNIKILLSSRHIDTCVAAFSSMPKLALQDLTQRDINVYVTDTIRSHPHVADTGYLDEAVANRLINDL